VASRQTQPDPELPFPLQEGERVLLFRRRHWVFAYPALVARLAAALVGPAVLLAAVSATAGLDGAAGAAAAAASAAWFLYWAFHAYFGWYRYKHDIWVVTNQRIVDSLKRHWFHHRMASADLVDVEDIALDRTGLLPTLFRFGNVRCQTAGELPNFLLAGIADPSSALALVDAARDVARRDVVRWREP
jgi:hypothetical protein